MIWTDVHDARLRQLFDMGLNDLKIGARIGCTRGMIAKRRLKLGLIRRDCRGVGVPDGPTEPVASGSRIDAMFRAAERPTKREVVFNRQAPPSLVSNGSAMT